MTTTELSAGDKIEARCSKCDDNTKHIIIAISDQTPDRVRCDMCDREHKYRAPKVAKVKAAGTTTKRTTTRRKVDPKEAERQEWQDLKLAEKAGTPKGYAMDGSFKLSNRIDHPTFGLGLVVGYPGPKKMEVLFSDGKKILRCA